jgi:hypothetical protein
MRYWIFGTYAPVDLDLVPLAQGVYEANFDSEE